MANDEPDSRQQARVGKAARKVLWVLLIIAIILAVVGVTVRLVSRSHLKKRTAADAEVTVTKPAATQADNELVLPGNVVAYMEAPIYARTSGYLKAWYTDIGTRVHKGELLAEIDTPEVDRQLDQARADLDTAVANSHLAQTTNERWQGLAVKQAVSKQDADEKAGDAAAKTAAEASARQNLKRLEDLRDFQRVVAPFDGIVTARNTDVGALINAGEASGAALFMLADIHVLRVYGQVPEPYAAATRAGLPAELKFAEHPGDSYKARTVRTSNALDPASRTLQVELQLDNKDGQLYPGAYAEIHFKLPSDRKTLRLPSNTILFRDTGVQVATVDASQTIRLKDVSEGRDFGQTIEILAGLQANDNVVINPPDSIQDGVKVHVAPPQQKKGGGSSAPGQKNSEPQGDASGDSKSQTPEAAF
jgi:RND family efflux transporter MFP subunit